MLDQNTDRMWYVIGAIVIGAGILFASMNVYDIGLDSVGDHFGQLSSVASGNVSNITGETNIVDYDDSTIDGLVAEGHIPIANAEELKRIRDGEFGLFGEGTQWENEFTSGVDKSYIQVAPIQLSSSDYFIPIGKYRSNDHSSAFSGTYDGGGHSITDLTIVDGSVGRVGLFGYTYGATIENVVLNNVRIEGASDVGGLVGRAYDTTITNSVVKGSIQGTKDVGGLIGESNNSTISDSVVDVSVHATNGAGGAIGQSEQSEVSNVKVYGEISGDNVTGGLIGENKLNATVTNSQSFAKVTGGSSVGGLIGRNENSTIQSSKASGQVSGFQDIGGLVGHNRRGVINNSVASGSVSNSSSSGFNSGGLVGYNGNSSVIIKSSASGNVTSPNGSVGGFIGENNHSEIRQSMSSGNVKGDYHVGGFIGFNNNSSKLSNVYSTSNVVGDVNVGGLVGYEHTTTISNSYAIGRVLGNREYGGFLGYCRDYRSTVTNSYYNSDIVTSQDSQFNGGLTRSEMKNPTSYIGWDFDTIWQMSNNQYPTLR